MPLPVQNAVATQALQKQFNLVGRYRAQLDEVIVPVAIVADVKGEGIPAETRQAVSTFIVPAVAAELSVFRFEVPNGVYASLNRIMCQTSTDTFLVVFYGSSFAVTPTAPAVVTFVDGRRRARGEFPAGKVFFDTQIPQLAVPEDRIPLTRATSGPNWFDLGGMIVGRDDAFDFVEFAMVTSNLTLTVSMQWEEFIIAV